MDHNAGSSDQSFSYQVATRRNTFRLRRGFWTRCPERRSWKPQEICCALFCLGGMTRNALTAVPQIKELYNERYTKLRKDSSINSD